MSGFLLVGEEKTGWNKRKILPSKISSKKNQKNLEDNFKILSLSVVIVQEIRQEEIDNYVPRSEK